MKNRLNITLSVITVVCLIIGVVYVIINYNDTSKKNTHDVINNRIIGLERAIEAAEEDVIDNRLPNDVSQEEAYELLQKAKASKNEAQIAWDQGHYDEASEYIGDAYEAIRAIPEFPTVLAAIVVMITCMAIYLLKRKKILYGV
ncbi:hypothetical protein ACFLUG_01860 [Chloroflexota bacterium]